MALAVLCELRHTVSVTHFITGTTRLPFNRK